jgi:hypothetical protein
MDVSKYLSEIEYSVSGIVSMIWHEHEDLARLRREIDAQKRVVDQKYLQAQSLAMNAEDPDDVAMAAGMNWETYFGGDKERHYKAVDANDLASRIDARSFAVNSLCGSLLQFAKQGISVAHGGLGKCPNGRNVSGEHLKQVIWQGRNQSIHWEEGNPNQYVQALFEALKTNVHAKFGDYRIRNCAFDIIELLNWRTLDDFNNDMNLLQ